MQNIMKRKNSIRYFCPLKAYGAWRGVGGGLNLSLNIVIFFSLIEGLGAENSQWRGGVITQKFKKY